jgi:Calpain family cysteine protease
MNCHCVTLFVLVFLAGCGFLEKSFSQQSDDSKIPSFAEVVSQHFGEWDKNGDGVLSKEEIAEAIAQKKLRGEAAAAMVTIRMVVLESKKYKTMPITLSFLANHNGVKKSERGTPTFQSTYRGFLEKLKLSSHELFPQSLPSLDALQQDELGDCFFLSTVGAMVYRNPLSVKSMFRENDDGTTTVSFGNGRKMKVMRATDADILICSGAGMNGIWLTVLEKAFRNRFSDKPQKGDPDKYDRLNGGDPALVIKMLDGHQSRSIDLKNSRLGTARLAETVRKDFIAAFREHLLVLAGTDKKFAPGIVDDHEYAVLGYDKKTDLVSVWNPWSNNFTPKGPDGLRNGYTTKNGKFVIPLKDLVENYGDITIETKELVR